MRIGQPRVMGEVVAGILLGPTLFGALRPSSRRRSSRPDIIPLIGVVANLGLIFYMFLVGLELDPEQLRGRVTPGGGDLERQRGAADGARARDRAADLRAASARTTTSPPFALFMGVAMSITAFPVLARILVERRMLKRPVGALALACAAIDDVTAWFLIALATAVAVAGSAGEVVRTIALRRRVLPA